MIQMQGGLIMRKYFLPVCLVTLILFCPSCSENKNNGILGIEVPVGNGKVSDKTPYIVVGVYEGSPAEKAGIKPGDRIVQINNRPIPEGMKYNEIFSEHLSGKPGTKVTIYIKRGSEDFVYDIIRAERSGN
jgi:C-terminal processing protease CtpA/Prc